MKRLLSLGLLIVMAIVAVSVVACSEQVEPGYKGKILSPSGYQEAVLPPGKYWVWPRQKLIKLDTSTNVMTESVKMKMSDGLEMTFPVTVRASIGGNDSVINGMFDDVREQGGIVSFDKVYSTYLRMVIQTSTRDVVSQYAAGDTQLNYARLSKEIYAAVNDRAKSLPMQISDVTLGMPDYPKVITDAINVNKERELGIQRIEAEKLQDMARKEGELAQANKQAEINLVNAKSIRDQNQIIADGISPGLLQYRALEVQQAMADKMGDGSTVYVPYGMIGGNAGLDTRVFSR